MTSASLSTELESQNAIVSKTLADAIVDTTAYTGKRVMISGRDNGIFEYIAATTNDGYGTIDATGSGLTLAVVKSQQFTLKLFGAVADDATDCYGALRAAVDYNVVGTGAYPSGQSVFIGTAGDEFYCSTTLQLKHKQKLFGDDSGLPSGSMTTIRWPADTRAIIVHRYNTIGDGVESPATTGADGSIITGFKIKGGKGTDDTAYGVWLRARAEVSRLLIANFAGNNLHIVASSGSGNPSQEGNANNFIAHSIRTTGSEQSGMYVDGADVNAAEMRSIDATANGTHGIFDSSFLGNTYTGCHASQNGKKGRVSDGTNRYYAKVDITNSTVTPASDPANWGRIGTGGDTSSYPLWVSGSDYLEGRPYKADSANARNVFIGCYSETGYSASKIDNPSLVVGGSFGANDGLAARIRDGVLENISDVQTSQLHIERSETGIGNLSESWNSGSFSGSRGVRHAFKSGTVDGSNEFTGAIFGLPSSTSIDTRHSVGLEIYDGIADDWEAVFTCRGIDNTIRWGVDNQWNLGGASYRAKEIFATNGTINTSDEREKTPIDTGFSEEEKAVALELKANIGKFRWLDSVETKGDGARIHIGIGAQNVRDIFEKHGLDGFAYGLLCYDEWEEEADDEGNVILEAGNRYGVRPGQISLFILANM